MASTCEFTDIGVDWSRMNEPNEAYEQDWLAGADTRDYATGKAIARFREALERVQAAELKRLHGRLPELNARSRKEIRHFADRLVATMLNPPRESLRDESCEGSPDALLQAFQRLFQLCD
jgi:glutamyl-tRNA reductase